MQTPILLNSKAHSKNVLCPKNVPYAFIQERTTDNYKCSRANMVTELKKG